MRPRSVLLALLATFLSFPSWAADWLYLTSPGDTLIGIGQQYLKNPRDWPKIQVANTVADPKLLPANTRIRIPVDLLKLTPAPATVTAVHGNVRFKTAEGSFQALRAETQLNGGETVLTGPGGSVSYRFADGTRLTQQASSRLVFGRLAAFGKTGMVSTELGLESGRVEASASRQQAPAGGFSVRTPVAVAGLRGTGFRLNLSEDGARLASEVLEGAVGVSAQGTEVQVAGGFGTIAEAGKPPAPPRALRPKPNLAGLPARVESLPLAFTWRPDMPARAWRAQIAADASFATVLLEGLFAEPSARWESDLADGSYFLRVRAVDEAGLEGFDSLHAFNLDARPLPPALTAPAAGARLYRPDAALEWAAAAGAQGYLVQIAPSADFAGGIREHRLGPQLRLEDTLPAGQWHWRVASLDAGGRPRQWSPPRALNVQPLPGVPGGGQARADGNRLHFAWNGSPGAAHYDFELAVEPTLANPLVRQRAQQTQTSAELKPGKYFWRVRGVEADGQAGTWSEASPVVLPPARPTEVTGQVSGETLTLAWLGEADNYRIEMARDANFAEKTSQVAVKGNRASLRLPAKGQYWLRVVAIGADGVEGPPSAPLLLTVQGPTPWWLLPVMMLPAL